MKNKNNQSDSALFYQYFPKKQMAGFNQYYGKEEFSNAAPQTQPTQEATSQLNLQRKHPQKDHRSIIRTPQTPPLRQIMEIQLVLGYSAFQQYDVGEVKKLLAVTEKLLITDLSLHYCRNAKILQQISFIEFSNLKTLYLSGNSIKNIQVLGKVNAPNLERLYLRKNYITSLRAFRKCNFKLKMLELEDNKLVVLSDLYQNCNLSTLQQLDVAYNKTLFFNFDFAKAQFNFKKMNIFQISTHGNIDMSSQTDLLVSLGVSKVRNIAVL